MNSRYKNAILSFEYPHDWELDESENEDGLTISLQSPRSLFLLVSVYAGEREPAEVADQALETMRQEYPVLDSDTVAGRIAGRPAVGHDVNFFSLDLTNTCWIRAFSANQQAVLLFAQANDVDLDDFERSLVAVFASIKIVPAGHFAD